jgi:ferric-dicitrate binding protein FerR (iron transport regulator)
MNDRKDDFDRLLDDATAEIRHQRLDEISERQATDRVWKKLQTELGGHKPLTGCEDFQAEIPAYIAGTLSEARALLVGDHTRGCVPCRRVLMAARSGEQPEVQPRRRTGQSSAMRILLRVAAAVLLIAGGFVSFHSIGDFAADRRLQASVQTVNGSLQMVDGDSSITVESGLGFGSSQVLRTAKDSSAFLQLADGSLIEMDERSQLALRASRRGTTIELARGNIIVHAADQHDGRLYVDTRDCQVAVQGTIFAVNHGLKGSRVSVIEGAVEVREGPATALLRSGDQLTTSNRLRNVPLEEEIGWSRDAERHKALLRELTGLRRVVADAVDHAPPRTSTELLEIAPGDTMIYAAMPNITEDLDEARAAFDQRLASSEVLAQWWEEQVVATGADQHIEELLDRLQPIGEAIGDEAVIAVPTSVVHQQGGPLFMAALDDPATFRTLLADVVADANSETTDHTAAILVDDPRTASPGEAEVLLWVEGNVFAAAGDLDSLRQLALRIDDATARDFVGTPLHTRLADRYANGVSWLLGVDLAGAISEATAEMQAEETAVMQSLGLLDATTLVVERHRDGEWYATNAEVQFSSPRRGVMAWLAKPAPMGSLDFVSPDAYVAASAVSINAADMFDDLLAVVSEQDQNAFDGLRVFEEQFGINLREDLAATLGGEATFALDGPMLPVPSWKLILEVYDSGTLINTIRQAIAEVNVELAARGEAEVVLETAESGGRSYYSLSRTGIDGTVVFAMVDGYMVMAPSRALIEQAIDYRAAGVTLPGSAAFRAMLPDNGYTDCSALVYRDLGSLVDAIPAEMLGELQGAEALTDGLSTGLVCVFAESQRVTASATGSSLVGLASTLGMIGSAHEKRAVIEELAEIEESDPVSSRG